MKLIPDTESPYECSEINMITEQSQNIHKHKEDDQKGQNESLKKSQQHSKENEPSAPQEWRHDAYILYNIVKLIYPLLESERYGN